MPTKKPRIQVTLSEKLNQYITEWAEHEHMSKSEVIAYIITEYTDERNKLTAEEELILNSYRYGNKEERDMMWKTWCKVDMIARKRREAEAGTNKIINIGRDNHGNISF